MNLSSLFRFLFFFGSYSAPPILYLGYIYLANGLRTFILAFLPSFGISFPGASNAPAGARGGAFVQVGSVKSASSLASSFWPPSQRETPYVSESFCTGKLGKIKERER